MQCNIGSEGKRVRAIAGSFCCVVGALGIANLHWVGFSYFWLSLGITFVITGAFLLFEASVGWCAVIALGRKISG